ncbi:hypothetical protein [Roseivirga thermotolerans]|uniref:Uncharacterized protein n=1 Tax=Roseivirga thermotolerans TaxID=1758176 RepID=A0ABQ3I5Z7_9BACT|nr:hypothetical protein [Roseivirga thermotolerans]GHE59480.1 hypothetical protein GCM10011340_12720 [Roseivirga thermotolerans]
MRYLNECEIAPLLNAGKVVEQFIGEFYHQGFKCYRYFSLQKDRHGIHLLVFEKFDESDEGLTSIYDFSSLDPDQLYGKEHDSFPSLNAVLLYLESEYEISSDKFLLAGQLDQVVGIG